MDDKLNLDDQLKLAQVKKAEAEASKLQMESELAKGTSKNAVYTDAIKILAGLVVGVGGFMAAVTQYEVAELRASIANDKLKFASDKLSSAEQAASVASAAAAAAVKQKQEAEAAIADLKKTHAELTAKVQASDPLLAPARLVYVQFRGGMTRERVNDLRAALTQAGYSAPGAERVAGDYGAQVKYFAADDTKAAEKLAIAVEHYLVSVNCPQKIRVLPAWAGADKQSPLELWLPSDCK